MNTRSTTRRRAAQAAEVEEVEAVDVCEVTTARTPYEPRFERSAWQHMKSGSPMQVVRAVLSATSTNMGRIWFPVMRFLGGAVAVVVGGLLLAICIVNLMVFFARLPTFVTCMLLVVLLAMVFIPRALGLCRRS